MKNPELSEAVRQKLYSYVLWFNPHEDLWYLVPRSESVEFFMNRHSSPGAVSNADLSDLVATLGD